MNVLFVCHGNIGRSQTAMEYFKKFAPNNQTDSAGTEVADTTMKIGEMTGANGIVAGLKEDGINISGHYPKQLTEQMAEHFDKVICMAPLDATPEWLKSSPKYTYWEIPDLKDKQMDQIRVIRDHIKNHVKRLLDV